MKFYLRSIKSKSPYVYIFCNSKHEFIIKSKLKVNKTEEPTTRANPKNISKETRSWVVGVVFADTRYKIIFDQDEIQRGWKKQRPA